MELIHFLKFKIKRIDTNKLHQVPNIGSKKRTGWSEWGHAYLIVYLIKPIIKLLNLSINDTKKILSPLYRLILPIHVNNFNFVLVTKRSDLLKELFHLEPSLKISSSTFVNSRRSIAFIISWSLLYKALYMSFVYPNISFIKCGPKTNSNDWNTLIIVRAPKASALYFHSQPSWELPWLKDTNP